MQGCCLPDPPGMFTANAVDAVNPPGHAPRPTRLTPWACPIQTPSNMVPGSAVRRQRSLLIETDRGGVHGYCLPPSPRYVPGQRGWRREPTETSPGQRGRLTGGPPYLSDHSRGGRYSTLTSSFKDCTSISKAWRSGISLYLAACNWSSALSQEVRQHLDDVVAVTLLASGGRGTERVLFNVTGALYQPCQAAGISGAQR